MHRRPAGSVMVVACELDDHSFTVLTGGAVFTLSEAISLQVNRATQDESDCSWDKLSTAGDPKAQ